MSVSKQRSDQFEEWRFREKPGHVKAGPFAVVYENQFVWVIVGPGHY
jgi:hypothetical protein